MILGIVLGWMLGVLMCTVCLLISDGYFAALWDAIRGRGE